MGDALGAPYEGLWGETIPQAGELLAGFGEFDGYPRGQWTDDTQLTVATIEAIVEEGEIDPSLIAHSIGRLWARGAVIGPGGACMRAGHAFLASGDWSTSGAPVGHAGNGTAMRMAALGLWFGPDEDLAGACAHVARITHQDPRSVAGGVAAARASQLLAYTSDLVPERFCAQIAATVRSYSDELARYVEELPRLLALPQEEAVERIAWAGSASPEFERPIITPFVIPTVLASLWAVLCNPESWDEAVTAVLRLGGDVDTTGAIVGGLMGARLGLSAIPTHLVEGVVYSEGLRLLAGRYASLVASRRKA